MYTIHTHTCIQAHQREREALGRRALAHPNDLEAQAAVAAGLERVNGAYIAAILACMTVSMFGVMEPWQAAESWVSAW